MESLNGPCPRDTVNVADCSSVKRMVFITEICVSGSELRVKKTDDYDWAEDAIASCILAIKTLRERYLEECLAGESAKEWLERTSEVI